jgi:hypothetical protein
MSVVLSLLIYSNIYSITAGQQLYDIHHLRDQSMPSPRKAKYSMLCNHNLVVYKATSIF